MPARFDGARLVNVAQNQSAKDGAHRVGVLRHHHDTDGRLQLGRHAAIRTCGVRNVTEESGLWYLNRLVFWFAPTNVMSMDKLFFRRLFSRPQKPAGETTETRAGHGDAEAQFSLGVKFAQEGAAQDYAQAAQWYLKAADQSHSLAQFNLGIMYGEGQGVPRDEATSMGWMQKAKDIGDAGAQYTI